MTRKNSFDENTPSGSLEKKERKRKILRKVPPFSCMLWPLRLKVAVDRIWKFHGYVSAFHTGLRNSALNDEYQTHKTNVTNNEI